MCSAAPLRVALLALFLALAGQDTCAYPLYVSANGTALLRSAYGGDVVTRAAPSWPALFCWQTAALR